MNKKINTAIKVLLALAVVLVVINAFRAEYSPYVKQVARVGTYVNSFEADGIFVRDEILHAEGVKGTMQAAVGEGEKVSAYSRLGAVVSVNADEAKIEELNLLTEEIEELTSVLSEAGVLTISEDKIDGTLNATLENLVYAAAKNDNEEAIRLSDDAKVLIERKSGIFSEESIEEKLNELISKRDALSKSLGGAHTPVTAQKAGVFSMNVDGMEEVLTFSAVKNQTAASVEKLMKDAEKQKPKAPCKVVNNYKWYILMSLTKDQSTGIELNREYKVSFTEIGENELLGKVTYISTPDKNGKCAVAMEFNRYIEDFTAVRVTQVRVLKERIPGIYIPLSAIRVEENGIEGVWVQNEAKLEFRSVEEIYRGDEYILASEKAKGKGEYKNIELYDRIVMNPDK